jgi:hypothetical protein
LEEVIKGLRILMQELSILLQLNCGIFQPALLISLKQVEFLFKFDCTSPCRLDYLFKEGINLLVDPLTLSSYLGNLLFDKGGLMFIP